MVAHQSSKLGQRCPNPRVRVRILEGVPYKLYRHIEKMEQKDENIWVPIGILEWMYQDDIGYIDEYFHTPIEKRDIECLMDNLVF